MMEDEKNLYIILGCNGSGKTIYFNFFLKKKVIKNNYLDIENIPCVQTRLLKIEEAMKGKKSIALETLFTGESLPEILSIVESARKNDYKINAFFIHTKDSNININNVQKSFSIGLLKFVDINELKHRYIKIADNIRRYSSYFDSLIIIDNSEYEFVELVTVNNRKIEFDINYLIQNPQKLMNKKNFSKKYSLIDDVDRSYIDYIELSYFNNN